MSDWSDYSREVQAASDASWGKQESVIKDLKCRIEELEANINLKADFIDATLNQLAASGQQIKELEAKLAKAVEATRKAADSIDQLNTLPPDENGHCWRESDLIDQEVMRLRATLAELKGENQYGMV